VNEIDEIRWQMAQIRHDLHQDVASVVSGVSGVVDEVSEVMDWRSVLRNHPYIATGAALAVGYLIVPRRAKQDLVKVVPSQNHLVSTQAPEAGLKKKRFRPISWAFELLGPIATQAIQAYALVWIENRIKEHLHTLPDGNASATQPGRQPAQNQGDDFYFKVPGHRG
jgi:hypothetical protein